MYELFPFGSLIIHYFYMAAASTPTISAPCLTSIRWMTGPQHSCCRNNWNVCFSGLPGIHLVDSLALDNYENSVSGVLSFSQFSSFIYYRVSQKKCALFQMSSIWDRKQVETWKFYTIKIYVWRTYFRLNHVFLTFEIKTLSTLFCPKSQLPAPKIA